MRVNRPADVADLRIYLRKKWEPGGVYTRALERLNDATFDESYEAGFDRRSLEHATLWWVSPEMCDLVEATAAEMPVDTMLSDLVIPASCGLVVFARPMPGTDGRNEDKDVRVSALLWGPANLPPLPERLDWAQSSGVVCLSMSSYMALDFDAGLEPDQFGIAMTSETVRKAKGLGRDGALHGVEWAPLGRSDWPVRDPLGQPLHPQLPPFTVRSMDEDRRLIAALWVLASSERLADVDLTNNDRPARRRAERRGDNPDLVGVRVVTLRRVHKDAPPSNREHESVEWSCRWVVRAHPRLQAYGPGRKQRKLIMVGPFTKGPDDKPMRMPTTVNALRR